MASSPPGLCPIRTVMGISAAADRAVSNLSTISQRPLMVMVSMLYSSSVSRAMVFIMPRAMSMSCNLFWMIFSPSSVLSTLPMPDNFNTDWLMRSMAIRENSWDDTNRIRLSRTCSMMEPPQPLRWRRSRLLMSDPSKMSRRLSCTKKDPPL